MLVPTDRHRAHVIVQYLQRNAAEASERRHVDPLKAQFVHTGCKRRNSLPE